jgi:hypothetical protein
VQRYADAAGLSKAIFDAVPELSRDQQLPEPPSSAGAITEIPAPPVLRSSQPSSGGASLAPELLREIERDLATFIGPMASIAVKRAVKQTNDLLELYELLGRQVNIPRDRSEFLARGRQRAASDLRRPHPLSTPKPETAARHSPDHATMPAGRANIVAIETDLTRYIGPIARILVKRELEKFTTLERFCLGLAAHIPDERDRRTFLNAHGTD